VAPARDALIRDDTEGMGGVLGQRHAGYWLAGLRRSRKFVETAPLTKSG
jgi:hypothetical protein